MCRMVVVPAAQSPRGLTRRRPLSRPGERSGPCARQAPWIAFLPLPAAAVNVAVPTTPNACADLAMGCGYIIGDRDGRFHRIGCASEPVEAVETRCRAAGLCIVMRTVVIAQRSSAGDGTRCAGLRHGGAGFGTCQALSERCSNGV